MPTESHRRVPRSIRLWSLREDVLVEDDAESDQLLVVTRWGEVPIRHAAMLVRECLRRMSMGPVSLENVIVSAQAGGSAGSDRSKHERDEIERILKVLSGSVVHSLALDDVHGPLLSAIPVVQEPTFAPRRIDPSRPVRLSRFAAMRPADDGLILESPLASYSVLIHRPLVTRVVASLNTPNSITELVSVEGIEQPVVADIVAYLVASGVVLLGESPGRFAEDDDPILRRWSHHELLFHSRSRMGRREGPFGAVFPHADEPAPPLVKPIPLGRRFLLHRPDQSELADDPSLTEVLDAHQETASDSTRQLKAQQIGELLFRSARLRTASSRQETGISYEISDRPYLSISGLYELELYLSIHQCTGLPRGIYHYDPSNHALTLLNDSERDVRALLDAAKVAAGRTQRPAALITITARAERLSWISGGMAYSTTLMHVGALQQIFALTATAMGLSTRAIVVEGSDTADRAMGIAWPGEIQIGECIIGHLE